MNDPLNELEELLSRKLLSGDWNHFKSSLVNAACLLQQGIAGPKTIDQMVFHPLTDWLTNLTPEEMDRIKELIKIDITMKGIMLDAIQYGGKR